MHAIRYGLYGLAHFMHLQQVTFLSKGPVMSTGEHQCEAARAKAWRLATVSCVMLLPFRTSFSSFATWSSRSAALPRLQI